MTGTLHSIFFQITGQPPALKMPVSDPRYIGPETIKEFQNTLSSLVYGGSIVREQGVYPKNGSQAVAVTFLDHATGAHATATLETPASAVMSPQYAGDVLSFLTSLGCRPSPLSMALH